MKSTSLVASCLGLLSKTFLVAACVLFFFGGRAMEEFANVNRMLAEAVGIALAFACVGIGFGLQSFVKKQTEGDGNLTINNRD